MRCCLCVVGSVLLVVCCVLLVLACCLWCVVSVLLLIVDSAFASRLKLGFECVLLVV